MNDAITSLHALQVGEQGDFYALLSAKQLLTTRDGKPYFRVSFRDAKREVSFPIWGDSPHATECRESWQIGQFYKLRAEYCETTYGPQLDILRIRPTEEADLENGFDPLCCSLRSRFEPEAMYDQLLAIANESIESEPLRKLVVGIYTKYREELLLLPAARVNHHAYLSGYLEHVLNVTRNTRYLVGQYRELYRDLPPEINSEIAVAGAMLHDIGKLRELATTPAGADYTSAGTLIGHILQGRDILREGAAEWPVDDETLLRLEHIIVSHQRLPEWGSPKPPMTPEALIVHYADDIDAKLQMMVVALHEADGDGAFTTHRNPLRQAIYRGEEPNGDAGEVEGPAD